MDQHQLIKESNLKMDEAIVHFSNELKTINTGRASTLLVEGVKVSSYGSLLPIKQVASLAAPDAHQIIITPWDKNLLGDIETAIRLADLGLSPTNDGKSVRISFPPMTEERRSELTKMVSKLGEEAKVNLRSIRGQVWENIQEAEKRSELTEDDRDSAKKELNDLIAKKNLEIDQIIKEKQMEVMKV